MSGGAADLWVVPGVRRPVRWRGRLHYELIDCGLRGHERVGADVAHLRPQDALLVREPGDGRRRHRCLRCVARIPLAPPTAAAREYRRDRGAIDLPLRGRPLRDRYVLRPIALDRVVHCVVLGVLAAAVFVLAADRAVLSQTSYHVLAAVQGSVAGPNGHSGEGLLGELDRAFAARMSTLWTVGAVPAAYALLEGGAAVGLWRGRRWADYVTFLATSPLLIPEVSELSGRLTPTKIVTW